MPSTSSTAYLVLVANHKGAGASKEADAIYTSSQAEQGKPLYEDNCSICHGPDMEGRAGPALKGKTFANPKGGLKVGDIFRIVSQNMPAPAPGSLAQDDYVRIMAYILQQNGYPAGNIELTFDSAGASKLKLTYTAPTLAAGDK